MPAGICDVLFGRRRLPLQGRQATSSPVGDQHRIGQSASVRRVFPRKAHDLTSPSRRALTACASGPDMNLITVKCEDSLALAAGSHRCRMSPCRPSRPRLIILRLRTLPDTRECLRRHDKRGVPRCRVLAVLGVRAGVGHALREADEGGLGVSATLSRCALQSLLRGSNANASVTPESCIYVQRQRPSCDPSPRWRLIP